MDIKKVLIAEDNQFILRGYKAAILEAGYEVETVSNGAEVLSRVEEFNPDLLVLDLMLPNINGFDILTELRARPLSEALPIIVASTLGQDEDREKVLALGASDFILKSHATVHDLIAKINACMMVKNIE